MNMLGYANLVESGLSQLTVGQITSLLTHAAEQTRLHTLYLNTAFVMTVDQEIIKAAAQNITEFNFLSILHV